MPQIAVVVVAGACLAFFGNQLPDRSWAALAPLFLVVAMGGGRYRLLLLGAGAYLWAAAFLHYQLEHRLHTEFDHRSSRVEVEITSLPQRAPGRVRFDVELLAIDKHPRPPPRRARLSWYQDSILPRAGERWQFEVRLRQPRATLNPAGFDYEKWLFAEGIDATGYVRESKLNRRLQPAGAGGIGYWRQRLADAIDAACPECRQRGLIKALALGHRADIGSAQQDRLRASGIAHLLAISGLHVGIVAMFAFALGRASWRYAGHRFGLEREALAAASALVAATGYAALAGFALPTQRALVMLVVILLALLRNRRVNLLQSLSLAVIVIVVADPRAVATASFWLSAGAVLVIALAQPRLQRTSGWWRQLLLLQLYFYALFTPPGLLIFEQLNPASLAANLVAIPLVSFVVLPSILAACLLLFWLPSLAATLLLFADRALQLLLDYCAWLLAQSLEAQLLSFPPPLLLAVLGAIAWLLLPRYLPGRWLAVGLVALALAWQPQRLRHGEFEAFILDVGLGSSVLLRTRHHSLVYDFGPGFADGYSAAEVALLPLLRAYRIGAPDLAIVSHVDHDHSGGLYRFLHYFPDSPLLSGTPRELARRFGLAQPPRSCHLYPEWRWDGVEFRFFSAGDSASGSNNRSCVLLVSGHQRLLLPGDIENKREFELLATHADALRAQVLLAPHHGSNTSSSEAFVRRVAPQYVVFTMSRNNRWGFPRAEVSARYRRAGSRLLRSDRDGAVRILSSADGLVVASRRQPPRRIWRRW